MKVDAIGVLDFQRHTLEIDATIRRGVVMGLFKISGDGGVRSSWGDTPYLMATLGGFHPKFHPEPAVFPKLNRILITVDKSHLPDAVELSASGYMAVTSNTIQFGATFTASIKSGNWKIEGSIGGDALIRHAVRVRRGDQGRRAREVPRAQPDRRQLQGRPRRARRRSSCAARCASRCSCSTRAGATASSSVETTSPAR